MARHNHRTEVSLREPCVAGGQLTETGSSSLCRQSGLMENDDLIPVWISRDKTSHIKTTLAMDSLSLVTIPQPSLDRDSHKQSC